MFGKEKKRFLRKINKHFWKERTVFLFFLPLGSFKKICMFGKKENHYWENKTDVFGEKEQKKEKISFFPVGKFQQNRHVWKEKYNCLERKKGNK